MDRPRSVNSRDLQALAQPLYSKADGLENDIHEGVDPHQVLKLLGMLGDIAHASIKEKTPMLNDPKLVEALLKLQNKASLTRKGKATRP